MTSITASEPIDQRTRWLSRRSIAAFVAGAVLATGAAIGVSASAADSGTPAVHASHAVTTDAGCQVRSGPC